MTQMFHGRVSFDPGLHGTPKVRVPFLIVVNIYTKQINNVYA